MARLTALTAGLVLCGCKDARREPLTLATLTQGQGTLERGRGGAYVPIAIGATLAEGDVLRTGNGSSARLEFAGAGTARVGEQSFVRLVTKADSKAPAVHVEFGNTLVESPAAFLLSTTRGLVRLDAGTKAAVRAGTKSTRVEVHSGQATFIEKKDDTQLAAGEGIEIFTGGAEVKRYRVGPTDPAQAR
jgi:hypothetical protein